MYLQNGALIIKGIDQYQLIEFFGTLPKIDEDEVSARFDVDREEISLAVTFFPPEAVYISLNQGVKKVELFAAQFEDGVKVTRFHKGEYDSLDLEVPFAGRFGEADWNYRFTLRITIDPAIRIELLP